MLKESFLHYDSFNRKGITVAIENTILHERFQAASASEREILMEENNEFFTSLMQCDLRCPKGDHSKAALQELKAQFPARKKFQLIAKGVKFYLCRGNADDYEQLLLMGNIDNEKRMAFKCMSFSDMMYQLHQYHIMEKKASIAGTGAMLASAATAMCVTSRGG